MTVSDYHITTPSGVRFSVVAEDSDMAALAAHREAKARRLTSCRAEMRLDGVRLGSFDLDGISGPSQKRVSRPVLDVSRHAPVAWHGYNDAGAPSGYSKRHLLDEAGQRTLCGRRVPSSTEREIADGFAQSEDCKACARAST